MMMISAIVPTIICHINSDALELQVAKKKAYWSLVVHCRVIILALGHHYEVSGLPKGRRPVHFILHLARASKLLQCSNPTTAKSSENFDKGTLQF
jgi:hypothetical protein